MPSSPLDRYAQTQKAGLIGRDLEANILMKSARRLSEARLRLLDGEPVDGTALLTNRRIWEVLMLSATAADNPLPHETKKAIANIGLFVLRRTFDQMAQPTAPGLAALIDLNRMIAEGLGQRSTA